MTGDGKHTLLYRAIDKAGNVEAEKAATIKIDGTRPTLLVAGVADGRVYGDATDVVLSWHAEDATSGLSTVTGALDGAAVTSGRTVALYQLPLGTHGFAVTATDEAGNITSQSLSFATTTSMRDVGQLLDRFRATNRLSLSAYKQLSSIAHQGPQGRGERQRQQGGALPAARSCTLARDDTLVGDADVRSVLERDGDAVIDSINGVAVLPQAVNVDDRVRQPAGRRRTAPRRRPAGVTDFAGKGVARWSKERPGCGWSGRGGRWPRPPSVGLLALRAGLVEPTGCVTERTPSYAGVRLPSWEDIVVGGHDIVAHPAGEAGRAAGRRRADPAPRAGRDGDRAARASTRRIRDGYHPATHTGAAGRRASPGWPTTSRTFRAPHGLDAGRRGERVVDRAAGPARARAFDVARRCWRRRSPTRRGPCCRPAR